MRSFSFYYILANLREGLKVICSVGYLNLGLSVSKMYNFDFAFCLSHVPTTLLRYSLSNIKLLKHLLTLLSNCRILSF